MKNNKEQIFIRVEGPNGDYYNKDIRDSTSEERDKYYEGISPGQIIGMLETALSLDE